MCITFTMIKFVSIRVTRLSTLNSAKLSMVKVRLTVNYLGIFQDFKPLWIYISLIRIKVRRSDFNVPMHMVGSHGLVTQPWEKTQAFLNWQLWLFQGRFCLGDAPMRLKSHHLFSFVAWSVNLSSWCCFGATRVMSKADIYPIKTQLLQ